MSDDASRSADGESTPQRLSRLEIVATALSALVIAFLLGVLLWDAAHPNAPPAFSVRAGAAERVGDAVRVRIAVRNDGDDAARNVIVHVSLEQRDSVVAESDLTIDWLPGRSSHDVVGFFPRPRDQTLGDSLRVKAEVHGYTEP